MATSNYRRPSCGQSFTEHSSGFSDHSAFYSDPTDSLTGGESMQATNTVSDRPATLFSAPGSTSEGSDGYTPGDAGVDIPATDSHVGHVHNGRVV